MTTSYNLATPELIEDPYPLYAELRARAPVCQVEPQGHWAVSRYDDVAQVLKHPEIFSSQGIFGIRSRLEDPRLQGEPLMRSDVNIVVTDPPLHTGLRKLVSGAFTPRAIARLEARVQEICVDLLGRLRGQGTFDLMKDLAVPLPVTVIAEMLGIDPALKADFKRWSDEVINVPRGGRPLRDEEVTRILRSRSELRGYLGAVIEARKRALGEDLVSDLLRGEAEYGALSDEDVLGMVILLLIAGNETTTNLLGNATLALAERPEAQRALRADLSLIPAFIEEALRYDPPVKSLMRRATREVTIAGVTLPAGAIVLPLLASANRDPSHFPDPDRFDITREPRPHLAFGQGIHFCVGAPLTRLEARIAFTELLRLPAFTREPGRCALAWTESYTLRGLRALPLRFEDAPAAA